MNNYYNKNGFYTIYKTDLSEKEYNKIKQDLTVSPDIKYNNFTREDKFKLYRETSKKIYIPFQYGIKNYGKCNNNYKDDSVDINIKFKGTLREPQEEIVKDIMKKFEEQGSGPVGCIIFQGTGAGKTVTSLNLLTRLKKKTLILVHKEFLMNQWKERIQQFIPEAKVGVLQGKRVEIDNDIVIGMIQSITSGKYPDNFFDEFGTVIGDEVHHLSCKSFSKTFFKTGSKKYNIGLSATPERKDGLTKVLNWFMGDIIESKTKTKRMNNSTVRFYNVDYSLCEDYPREKLNSIGKINLASMITEMTMREDRNNFIVDIIIDICKDDSKKILLMSDRIEHLKYLYKVITKKTIKTVGLYIGKMKEQELKVSSQCDIILASYSMASEGFDVPELNTLILSTPKSDITQSIGRIFRKEHKDPLIVDICDNHSLFIVQGYKRKRLYRSLLTDVRLLNINHVFGKDNDEYRTGEDGKSTHNIVEFIEE
jgi:superfamily II DNA or RNA helicase